MHSLYLLICQVKTLKADIFFVKCYTDIGGQEPFLYKNELCSFSNSSASASLDNADLCVISMV